MSYARNVSEQDTRQQTTDMYKQHYILQLLFSINFLLPTFLFSKNKCTNSSNPCNNVYVLNNLLKI